MSNTFRAGAENKRSTNKFRNQPKNQKTDFKPKKRASY